MPPILRRSITRRRNHGPTRLEALAVRVDRLEREMNQIDADLDVLLEECRKLRDRLPLLRNVPKPLRDAAQRGEGTLVWEETGRFWRYEPKKPAPVTSKVQEVSP